MAYAHVAHACRVGNEVIMSNGATLAGDITVEDQASIGGLSAVHQFTRIGRLCFIGGCTAVRQDCPPFMLVAGNPASVHGPNVVGMQRRHLDPHVQRILREAYRILYRRDLSTSQAVAAIRAELDTCPELDHLLRFIEQSERGITKRPAGAPAASED
jgi:UDP-N-acetylglucosamine acyltransferase